MSINESQTHILYYSSISSVANKWSEQENRFTRATGHHMNALYDTIDTEKLHTKHSLAIWHPTLYWYFSVIVDIHGQKIIIFLGLREPLTLGFIYIFRPTHFGYVFAFLIPHTPTITWVFVITNYHLYFLHFFLSFSSLAPKNFPLLHQVYIGHVNCIRVPFFFHFVWWNVKFKILLHCYFVIPEKGFLVDLSMLWAWPTKGPIYLRPIW